MRSFTPQGFCCGRPETMSSSCRLRNCLTTTRVIAGICLCLTLISPGHAQGQSPAQPAVAKEKIVTNYAIGTFDVKVTSQTAGDGDEAAIGKMTLDKQFHGDLEGTSKGVCWRPQPASKAQPAMSPWKRSREL